MKISAEHTDAQLFQALTERLNGADGYLLRGVIEKTLTLDDAQLRWVLGFLRGIRAE